MKKFEQLNEHQAFVDWKERHPQGRVINWRSQTRPMLHKADCWHMVFEPDDDASLTKHSKDCFRDKSEFDEWSATHEVEGWSFVRLVRLGPKQIPRLRRQEFINTGRSPG